MSLDKWISKPKKKTKRKPAKKTPKKSGTPEKGQVPGKEPRPQESAAPKSSQSVKQSDSPGKKEIQSLSSVPPEADMAIADEKPNPKKNEVTLVTMGTFSEQPRLTSPDVSPRKPRVEIHKFRIQCSNKKCKHTRLVVKTGDVGLSPKEKHCSKCGAEVKIKEMSPKR